MFSFWADCHLNTFSQLLDQYSNDKWAIKSTGARSPGEINMKNWLHHLLRSVSIVSRARRFFIAGADWYVRSIYNFITCCWAMSTLRIQDMSSVAAAVVMMCLCACVHGTNSVYSETKQEQRDCVWCRASACQASNCLLNWPLRQLRRNYCYWQRDLHKNAVQSAPLCII
jgi:hypothetical protein